MIKLKVKFLVLIAKSMAITRMKYKNNAYSVLFNNVKYVILTI